MPNLLDCGVVLNNGIFSTLGLLHYIQVGEIPQFCWKTSSTCSFHAAHFRHGGKPL